VDYELPSEIEAPASVPYSMSVHPNMHSTGITLTFARVAACWAGAGACYLLSLLASTSTAVELRDLADTLAVMAAGGGMLLGSVGRLMRRIVPDHLGRRERELLGRALAATGSIRAALAEVGGALGDDAAAYGAALESWEWLFARALVDTGRQADAFAMRAARRNQLLDRDAMYRGLERDLQAAEHLAFVGEREVRDAAELAASLRDLQAPEPWWREHTHQPRPSIMPSHRRHWRRSARAIGRK
jgi:hypothetical protein